MTTPPDQLPGDHPLPSQDFTNRPLPIYQVPVGTVMFRIHDCNFGAIYYNTNPEGRFNSPDSTYGVLYIGSSHGVVFREAITRDKYLIDFHPNNRHIIHSRCITELTLTKQLNLADLTGARMAHVRADNRLFTGAYSVSQSWSKAIYHHPYRVDGIRYHSRYDPEQFCYAFFSERTNNDCFTNNISIPITSLAYRSELAQIIATYRFDIRNLSYLPT